jgi:mitochondrial enoyl-[acyl-carrier protein] reductase / trans-2-enoyl-CoA reductase
MYILIEIFRPDFDALQEQLKTLGANHVLTYDELEDKSLRQRVKEWTGGKVRLFLHNMSHISTLFFPQDIRLGLNCVGGKETSLMAGLLGHNAHLVSYGAMSKQPLSFPTSYFIYKNLTCHGFWQSRWYKERTREERENLMNTLAGLIKDGKVRPSHNCDAFAL